MSKKFVIGENRAIVVKKKGTDFSIVISEDGSEKFAEFSGKRWTQFVSIFEQVDESLKQIAAKQYVKYCAHVGGKWYVSVKTGFACVDIREFYYSPNQGPRPRKKGIALRLREWDALKEVVQRINDKFPMLTKILPCWSQSDHYNQESAMLCTECYPFLSNEMADELSNSAIQR